jgi:hypothetical protein
VQRAWVLLAPDERARQLRPGAEPVARLEHALARLGAGGEGEAVVARAAHGALPERVAARLEQRTVELACTDARADVFRDRSLERGAGQRGCAGIDQAAAVAHPVAGGGRQPRPPRALVLDQLAAPLGAALGGLPRALLGAGPLVALDLRPRRDQSRERGRGEHAKGDPAAR